MKRVLGVSCVLSLAGFGSALASLPSASASQFRQGSPTVPGQLMLDAQELALEPNAPFSLSFHADDPLPASATMVLTAYPPIERRQDLLDAIAGNLERATDTVRISALSTLTSNGVTTLIVPTETNANTKAALGFARPGLYPVVLVISDSENELGRLLTFVDRLPSDDLALSGVLNVAVVASVTAPPAIVGADPALLAVTRQALADLQVFPDTVPISVAVSPELLERASPATLDALRQLFDHNLVLSEPRIPFDPSAAAAAGRSALYARFLREGENVLFAVGQAPASDRSVWLSSSLLTTSGAALLRDLGTRLLVLSPKNYQLASGNLGAFTDTTQLIGTLLPDGTSMPALVIDPILASRLREPLLSLEQAALYIAADLVAIRDHFAGGDDPVTGRTIALGLDTGGVPSPTLLARVQAMTSTTGAVDFVTLDGVLGTTTAMVVGGTPVEIILPLATPVDLSTRLDSLDGLATKATNIASMLVDDSGRAQRWADTIDVLSSSSLNDLEFGGGEAALKAEYDGITGSVVPRPAYAFTLTGRRTTIRIPIENTGPEPLRVLIRLSATKLTFPNGDQIAELAPGGITDIEVPVVARSNGKFGVALDILTPDGKTQLADRLFLQARVFTLTGLALMLTGGGLLAVLAWWLHHLRTSKRTRRRARAEHNHPAPHAGRARATKDPTSANVSDS